MPVNCFPDNSPIDDWFSSVSKKTLSDLGRPYVITDYGVADDGKVYTEELQSLIDTVSENGGGVLVVPAGTYYTGALFFKRGVNLYIQENALLMGSDDISDYPVCTTRIEGETCKYFPALINADGLDGFTIAGKGTIDGNGLKSWKAFWIRKEWYPDCTNKDEQRPRLIYISNCTNVEISGLRLQNSHFWTTHFYKCKYIKLFDCYIYSPYTPVPAPSTDAVDIDACSDVHISGCYFHVNDDAVALKGGKGPDADILPENGSNERIIVEYCEYGFCHSCITCGSEAIHCKNIIVRNIKITDAYKLLWLKMRPDTPQNYEYITVENAVGNVGELININPWTQFYNLKGHTGVPLSRADSVNIRNCDLRCEKYLNIKSETSQYSLSRFTLEKLKITSKDTDYPENWEKYLTVLNVAFK